MRSYLQQVWASMLEGSCQQGVGSRGEGSTAGVDNDVGPGSGVELAVLTILLSSASTAVLNAADY